MADKKPSGFRFRLPWLLQPALSTSPAIAPEPATQPARTTTQTSAPRPPFRPPGIAPAPVLPTQAQPRSASLPVSVVSAPPPVVAKSSAPESMIAKPLDPVATQPAKETQTTSESPGLVVVKTSAVVETRPTDKAQATIETFQATETPSPKTPPTIETRALATSPAVDAIETQPTKETKAAAETVPTIETRSLATPPAIDAIETHPTNATQTTTETKPTIETRGPEGSPFRPPRSHPSPPPTSDSQPSSPASQPREKTSPLPLPPTVTKSVVEGQEDLVNQAAQPHSSTPEIKRLTDFTQEKNPTDGQGAGAGADLGQETTEVKGAETKSLNPYTETKSQKPKPVTLSRIPLHKEIKDDISKFIHKMATKQNMKEKPASVITVAGDNIGASMHLGSDAINGKKSEKDSKKATKSEEAKAIVNSNIQGINNSIMFNSSVTEQNPGVHLGFSRNVAKTKPSKMKKSESMEAQRAETNITPPQTLVYDPKMGREVSMEADDPETSGKGYEIEVV